MTAAAVDELEELSARVEQSTAVVALGAGTQREIGGRVRDATELRAPVGILDFQPFDMTITVWAGTSFATLDGALAEHGQECPLDPADPTTTIGGIIATGLSGIRRLGHGPMRDHLLEVEFITAAGTRARGGGPTVKNVTGYDIPRLFVGSLGTLGLMTRVILRTRPRATTSTWFRTPDDPDAARAVLFAPTAIVRDGATTSVLLEGDPGDLASEATRGSLISAAAPDRPRGAHRGRIAVDPALLVEVEAALATITGLGWLAEYGVGTVHVAGASADALAAARTVAESRGGWLLREAGAPDLDPFGTTFPATALQRRIRRALDPTGKLSPGRVPATETP